MKEDIKLIVFLVLTHWWWIKSVLSMLPGFPLARLLDSSCGMCQAYYSQLRVHT